MLEPHRRAAEQPKQNIETTYWPGKGEFDVYEQSFRSLRMLGTVAGHLADQYVWPHPIGLEMASCGEISRPGIARHSCATIGCSGSSSAFKWNRRPRPGVFVSDHLDRSAFGRRFFIRTPGPPPFS